MFKDAIVAMYGNESESILYQLEKDLKVDIEESLQKELFSYEELWGDLTPQELMKLPDEF